MPPEASRRPRGAGYAKGDGTRAAIVAAALTEFGQWGFALATTRRIAQAAKVNLPAIAYYFGNKEQLYLACAGEIVAGYHDRAAGLAEQAAAALQDGAGRAECRAFLRRILHLLMQVFVDTGGAQHGADFVAREMRDRGPAFALLYQKLWQPGVEIVARLVAGMRGRAAPAAADSVDALMLISSLLAFHSGRDVSLQILGWSELDAARMAELNAAVDRFVDALAGP